MSEIHIGPHTREDAAAAHGAGENHHTYDREINLKAIGKWMGGLLVLAVIIQILMWWLLRGLEGYDKRADPELLPIEREMKLNEQPPPEPRLQVTPAFEKLNADAISRSDVEDMQALHKREDEALGHPSWIDRGQGRVRVPIDVAMEVIASRGAAAAAAAPPAAPAADGQQPPAAGAPPGPQEQ
jgi:hypothetical protein